MFTFVLLACLATIAFKAVKAKMDERAAVRAQSVESWKELIANRKPTLGNGKGALTIIEFSDYQCPYCKAMEPRLQQLIEKHPGSINLYRYDFPLESIHPYARGAANAADCAAKQGVTEAYQSQLFQQRTLESFNWAELARKTGVPDLAAYRSCLDGDQSADAIKRDVDAGKRLSVTGTPTFIVNGTIFRSAITADQLEAAYSNALKH